MTENMKKVYEYLYENFEVANIDTAVAEYLQEHYQAVDAEDSWVIDSFNDMLDECYDVFRIGTLEYYPSDVFSSVDPIAYRQGLLEYYDSLFDDTLVYVASLSKDYTKDDYDCAIKAIESIITYVDDLEAYYYDDDIDYAERHYEEDEKGDE